MKKILLSTITIVFSVLTYAQNLDSKVAEYLNNQDYLTLKEVYPLVKDSITPFLQDLTECFLPCYFNKPEEACKSIQNFFTSQQGKINSDLATSLIYLWAENLKAKGAYKEAVELIDNYLLNFPQEHRIKLKQYYSSIYVYCKAYQSFQASKISHHNKDISVPISFVQTGERGQTMFIPVTIRNNTTNFIFDTGAGDNVVTEKFALDNQIRILKDSILIIGVGSGYGKLGFIDSLQIGELIYQNVSFVVVPEIIPDNKYNTQAVLGMPFMRINKELIIYPNERKIVFPYKESIPDSLKSNMILTNNTLLLNVESQDNMLLIQFDSGNVSSTMNLSYFKSNKTKIENQYKLDTIQIGGFRGINTIPAYTIPQLSFSIGISKFIMKNIKVLTKKNLMEPNQSKGVYGVNFIQKFDRICINFNLMRLEVQNISNNDMSVQNMHLN
ncbi:MAG: retroviral-like aspartic protease family protein [Labilibaculum sp.]|nr:retroviral-like aspartic protease family protein [Labilibaculum sp.]